MPATHSVPEALPGLESGDHLDRVEFERRYEARDDDRKVELIGGVVFVASPVRRPHSSHASLLGGLLERYAEVTPDVDALCDASLRLGPLDEPQPDLLLRVARGGTSHVDEEQYVAGPVELLIEVAHSSVALDLHEKKACYERHGCREYLVVLVAEREVRWFAHDGVVRPAQAARRPRGDERPSVGRLGVPPARPARALLRRTTDGVRYAPFAPEPDGTLRSRVFPGLWLDPEALFATDRPRLVATLRAGLATREHAAFVEALRAR